MREIRKSGSEGGGAHKLSLPLSQSRLSRHRAPVGHNSSTGAAGRNGRTRMARELQHPRNHL